jgi:ribosomal RNA-processing protein 36
VSGEKPGEVKTKGTQHEAKQRWEAHSKFGRSCLSVGLVGESNPRQVGSTKMLVDRGQRRTRHPVHFNKRFHPTYLKIPPAMVLANKLDRTLRAAEDSSDAESYYEVTDRSSSASVIEADEGGNVISSDGEEDAESGDDDMVSSCLLYPPAHTTNTSKSDASDDDQVKAQMSKVSFGALAKAQDALSKQQPEDRKRKRGDDTSKSQEDKLEALRERLRQIKAEKLANGAQPSKKAKTTKSKNDSKRDTQKASDGEDSDPDAAPHARSSKHAPAVQSSKRMVSRKRNVVDVKKPVFRDPRFNNVSGPQPDEFVVGKRYSFLSDYRKSEISELRQTIKKTKNEDEKERLKKKLLSMESQEKARENKEKLQDVAREHKKKEKELVKEGKKPFFLKKCMFMHLLRNRVQVLTRYFSRTKEDCIGRSLPEHEIEAARQGHRTPSQEGYGKGTEKYARRAPYCWIVYTGPANTLTIRCIQSKIPLLQLFEKVRCLLLRILSLCFLLERALPLCAE